MGTAKLYDLWAKYAIFTKKYELNHAHISAHITLYDIPHKR